MAQNRQESGEYHLKAVVGGKNLPATVEKSRKHQKLLGEDSGKRAAASPARKIADGCRARVFRH